MFESLCIYCIYIYREREREFFRIILTLVFLMYFFSVHQAQLMLLKETKVSL